jgi:hypothetical protein
MGKKRDGNVAFKVTYNDSGWNGICSDKLYEINSRGKYRKPWCSHPDCECREYRIGDYFPCYDSIALRKLCFTPGATGRGEPYRCREAEEGKIALLTSKVPGDAERERFIFGILLIRLIAPPTWDTGVEVHYGDEEKSIVLTPAQYIRLWDYHSNPNSPEIICWKTGLFRYVTDATCRSILVHILNDSCYTDEQEQKAKDLLKIAV